MGKAILHGLLTSDVPAIHRFEKFIISVRSLQSVAELKSEFAEYIDQLEILRDANVKAASNADVIFLAFPPSQVRNALGDHAMPDAAQGKLVISILAGVSECDIEKALSSASRAQSTADKVPSHIVRAMPSIGAHVNASTTLVAVSEPPLPQDLKNVTWAIFESIGDIRLVPDSLFGEMTAISATCLALMSVVIDAITDGGVSSGIPRHMVQGYAGQCIRGYANLIARGESLAELKNSLMIPKGITIQAILSLNKGGVRSAISDTVLSTVAYTESMSKW